jgi:hypothetical protein
MDSVCKSDGGGHQRGIHVTKRGLHPLWPSDEKRTQMSTARRKQLASMVARRLVRCVVCDVVIEPSEFWDASRNGPRHRRCGPQVRNLLRGPRPKPTSREW